DAVYVPSGQTVANIVTGSAPVSRTGAGADASTGSAVNVSAATMIPLSAIARWQTGSTPAVVNHQDAQPSATISFNLANGYTLSDAAQRIAAVQAAANLPATVHGSFAGTAQVFQQSLASTPLLI